MGARLRGALFRGRLNIAIMAKPPVDADPEKFIIGRGHYSNLEVARSYSDERVFRIEPTPMPGGTIIIFNLLFVAAVYGFHWALNNLTNGRAGSWVI